MNTLVARTAISLSILLSAVLCRGVDPAELRRALVAPSPHVFVVAHRGDWRKFPENSLPAILSCVEMGIDMAELDLGRTKDGQLVLMHDSTVDRTTTGTGKVADLTLAEIKALRLKNGYGVATPFTVPTFREVLVASHGRILLNLDKSYKYFREMMPLLEETGTSGEVLMKGSLPAALVREENQDLLQRVLYMPVIDFTKPGAIDQVKDWLAGSPPCAMEFVFPRWEPVVEEAFALCRARNVRIWVNLLWPALGGGTSDDLAVSDPEGVYGLMLKRGVSMFQTDRPQLLQSFLAGRTVDSRR